MLIRFLLSACVVILASINVIGADVYSGTTGFHCGISTQGFYGNKRMDKNGSISTEVSFDWSEASLTFDSYSLFYPGGTYQNSKTWTVGPGQAETVSLTVTFDPLYLEKFDVGPVTMSPALESKYDVDGDGLRYGSYSSFGDVTFTGSYVVSGPTETKEGIFTADVLALSSQQFPEYHTLDTTNYPNSMVLKGFWGIGWNGPVTIMDETVDGRDVDMVITGISYAWTGGPISLTHTPEPSALLLITLGLLSLIYGWRGQRMHC